MNKFAGKVGRSFQVVAVLLVVTAGLKAQEQLPKESSSAAQMRALNNSVLQIHGRMQQSAGGETASIRNEAAMAIAQRSAALAKLIQEDPRAALSFAFSPELLADLTAKFPSATSQLEQHVTVRGQLERWVEDGADLKTSHTYSLLKVGPQTLNLHFAGPEPSAKPGELLEATGVLAGSKMAVSTTRVVTTNSTWVPAAPAFFAPVTNLAARLLSPFSALLMAISLFALLAVARLYSLRGRVRVVFKQFAICIIGVVLILSSPSTSYSQSACSTTGAQNVVVLLVTFPGVTPPSTVTPQSVHDIFFSTTGPSVDGYWREASYGQTSATGDVYGWYTLSGSYSCSTITQMRDDAIAAASASGVSFSNGSRVFIVFPDTLGCGWAGMALFGCTTLNTPTSSFTGSISYLSANWISPQGSGVAVAAHEAGHNMGLDHAQSRTFSTEPLGPLATAGTLTEYGDPFSAMSTSNIGHYALPQKAEILNWISSGTNYQVVQSGGTWTLQPLEVNPSGLVALKVQRGTGNNAWLWVEYRQPIGIYESIWAPSGALIHYEDSTTGGHTQLLDFTPATSGMYDSALMPAGTWTDPYSNVSIAVQSATTNGLTVNVNYGAVPCSPSAPSVSVSPLNPSIYPGQSASYSASVTNNDSSGCASSTINLGSNEPSGWSTSLSSPSVTLSPGQSASLTMGKGAPNGTPPGTYAVNLNASTNSAANTGTANATVITPPSLAVNLSLSSSIFSRPSTASITAAVTSGGTPASGASVTFTLIPPNGNTTTQTVTAGSNGLATWNYKLNSRSQVGLYSVSALAAPSSGSKKAATTQTVGSNTVTFTVQ